MNKGARTLIDYLKLKGYLIIVLTARPIYKYPEVFRDTLLWLRNNKIHHDLLFGGGKDKHIQILKYFPNLQFMVEDNSDIANNIAKTGYKCFLLNNIYNQGKIHKKVVRIKHLAEVEKHVY
jgi:uncharacterized HAD superfamily protein